MDFLDNNFDLILVAVVAFLGLRGFLSGFLKELSSTIGIIGGIYLSANFSHFIEKFITENISLFSNSHAVGFVSFLIGVIGFMLLSRYFILIVANLIKYEQLTSIDRIAGIMLSLIKNFLFISIIITSLNNIEFVKKGLSKYTMNSKIFPVTIDIGHKFIGKIINQINQKNMKNAQPNSIPLPKISY